MKKFAVFNRVVINEDIYCIDFETPLWFLEDEDGTIVSNRYGIVIQKDDSLDKDKFYNLVKEKVIAKFESGHIPDATSYTKEEWDKHCNEVMEQQNGE